MKKQSTSLLIVDDNYGYVRNLSYFFSDHGYHVECAWNLRQAIRMVEDHAPDVVFSDKNIGGHRGVVPFLDYLKAEKPWTPVILVSAEDGKQAKKELYCHDFFDKHWPFEKMLRRINRMLPDFGLSPPQPRRSQL